MIVRLYLCRHGETVAPATFYGHDDVALSDLGRQQAQAQAIVLAHAKLGLVKSSDLQRARQGAELVAARHGVEVRIDPALREMHLGVLEGRTYADALKQFPDLAGRSYADMLDVRFPDGGESVRDVAERALPCVERTIAIAAASARTDRIALGIYAHNTVCRVVLAHAAGLGAAGYVRFAQRYGAINRVDVPIVGPVARDGDRVAIDWAGATIVYANLDPLRIVRH